MRLNSGCISTRHYSYNMYIHFRLDANYFLPEGLIVVRLGRYAQCVSGCKIVESLLGVQKNACNFWLALHRCSFRSLNG